MQVPGATLNSNGGFNFNSWADAEKYLPDLLQARLTEEEYPDDIVGEDGEYLGLAGYNIVIYPKDTPAEDLPEEVDGAVPEDILTSVDGNEWLVYGYMEGVEEAYALDFGRLDPWGPLPSWNHP
jgi:hypothetical protein